MKKIEDYLHLYLGCEAYWQEDGIKSTYPKAIDYDMLKNADWIKPLLRPLSDITEEELDDCTILSADMMNIISDPFSKERMIVEFECNARVNKYLLSKGFDLFGLIEDGLAIDKTKN